MSCLLSHSAMTWAMASKRSASFPTSSLISMTRSAIAPNALNRCEPTFFGEFLRVELNSVTRWSNTY